MLPAANVAGAAATQPVQQTATGQVALRTAQTQAPETARTSAGEAAAANVRPETAQAVRAAQQSAIAARLRDQEKAESSERKTPGTETHAGPPPTFEESPLQRQARTAFDPPEVDALPHSDVPDVDEDASAPEAALPRISEPETPPDPPPTPTERAEVSFAETQALAEKKEPATVDVAR